MFLNINDLPTSFSEDRHIYVFYMSQFANEIGINPGIKEELVHASVDVRKWAAPSHHTH